MMRFDSANPSFLGLLAIESYRKKLKVQNSKELFPKFAVNKNVQKHILSLDFCHVTHPQDLKNSLASNDR